MRKKLFIACLIALPSLLLYAAVTGNDANYYMEDFTSKLYCDTLNTTAIWDTISGELKLPPFELTLAGSYDTPFLAMSVAIAGDYAYVADQASGLLVIDISDPTSPSLAGSYDTPYLALGIAISGDYAYVADDASGLHVIDISDPTSPSLAGSYDTPGNAYGVSISGDYAYVVDHASGLLVIDISDPTSPSLAGSYDTPGLAFGIAISGDHAYLADHTSGLLVIDISDPASPSLAGSYDTPSYSFGVSVLGDYCYVADYASGLLVIDISDPASPSLAGSYDTPSYAYNVTVSGDYCYVADYASGLQAIDVRDPASPSLSGSYDTQGYVYDVTLAGAYAYVADYDYGLEVIDISDPTDPSLVGSYDTPSSARNVALAGDCGYVAAGYLEVIDISDPTSPSLAGSLDTPGAVRAVALAGDYAYAADGPAGLQVIDISDPTSPTVAGGTGGLAESAEGIALAGDYAYVGASGAGIYVIDISDPTNPMLSDSCDTPGSARGIALAGDYAYVADGSEGLQVIDISDPTNPTIAGSYNTANIAYDVAIAGDYAYVADGFYLMVIDISDPTSPSYAGGYGLPGGAFDVTVSGDYAYVANGSSGLCKIDISDPEYPLGCWSYDTPGTAWGVALAGDYAYVADWDFGLEVIWIYQRFITAADSTAQSVQINPMSEDILTVQITSTQTDSIRWEVSANGGADWQEVFPDATWNIIAIPGIDLRWRSKHVYSYPFVNPTCSNFVIEWLHGFPLIDAITDIMNDQGREVSITWTRSGYDDAESTTPVTEYAIYRRIDDDLMYCQEPVHGAVGERLRDKERSESTHSLMYPPGDWDYVASVPANCEDTYAAVVPTLADSTITEGMYYTTFFVRARTASPAVYFDSPPDSGYSVDNLAPHVPLGFAVAYNTGSGTELSWEECSDEDFDYFCIYRGESEEFEPDPGNLVHMTTDTGWLDTVEEGWRYSYKISAVDFSGNESDAASAGTVTGDDTPTAPEAFALYQNVPNPFNPTTTIRFDLPVRSHVRLSIYNVKGQIVRMLLNRDIDAGSREVRWDGRDSMGRGVASGIYFYRLYTPAYSESRKMILLR